MINLEEKIAIQNKTLKQTLNERDLMSYELNLVQQRLISLETSTASLQTFSLSEQRQRILHEAALTINEIKNQSQDIMNAFVDCEHNLLLSEKQLQNANDEKQKLLIKCNAYETRLSEHTKTIELQAKQILEKDHHITNLEHKLFKMNCNIKEDILQKLSTTSISDNAVHAATIASSTPNTNWNVVAQDHDLSSQIDKSTKPNDRDKRISHIEEQLRITEIEYKNFMMKYANTKENTNTLEKSGNDSSNSSGNGNGNGINKTKSSLASSSLNFNML
jgi:hypothetical protein